MAATHQFFVVCLRNAGYRASLERLEIYPALADADAASHGQIRVVDESGEDYLYPAGYFAAIELPQQVRKAMRAAA